MIGKTLGHYRVGEQLGRGGMGEVYLADDLNLNRKVALKFLPDAFTGDLERMARFEREAKLLASLNHPNIAAIYGLEQAEGKRFLVLELVEGETLAQRISKGPLPVEEALGVCRQISEGLEAAHEKGVIHRDLKPANVMITAGDRVKILDFGLAKALANETQSVDSSQSPTLTEAMTRPGVILGTAAYMSPEQAKGKSVDKRADIWAFGCILYECLTGKRAFEGETVTETLAAILKGEPDWKAVPATTPANICFVLRRCLEKDVNHRLHDAADARMLIEAPPVDRAIATARLSWLAWIVAGVLFLALALIAFIHFREKPIVSAEMVQLQITLPDTVNVAPRPAFALSPDGRHLVFGASDSDGLNRLWIRNLDSLEAQPLPGSDLKYSTPFFWSPDSRFIAFDAGGMLKKINISGGPPLMICKLNTPAVGGSWNRDGVIIFGAWSSGVMRVPAVGGIALPVTKPDPTHKEGGDCSPTFLPDGRHFLYWRTSESDEIRGVYVGSLDNTAKEQGRRLPLEASSYRFIYVPSVDSGPGRLLFLRGQILMAQLFDDKRLELIGEALPVAEPVGSFAGDAFFSVSTNGILVYRSGSASQNFQATWFDRQGKTLGKVGEPGSYNGLALSPDGEQVAISQGGDLWLLDLSRGTNTRFTFGNSQSAFPIWSPDGNRITFSSTRHSVSCVLLQKSASGARTEELLLESRMILHSTSWSRDGRFLLYSALDPKTKGDIWVLPLEGARKPMRFLQTEFIEHEGRFSPDMRWIAYVSDESGIDEIYVRGFSQTDPDASSETSGKWQLSKGGGAGPRWRRDGKELYYRAPDGRVMAVEIMADVQFRVGIPKSLFQAPPEVRPLAMESSPWDVSADGDRFLLVIPTSESSPTPFIVVFDWMALLKK
jgi:eukaryotic-like serine/threonine-protein kinase